jgi:hypothetical protein
MLVPHVTTCKWPRDHSRTGSPKKTTCAPRALDTRRVAPSDAAKPIEPKAALVQVRRWRGAQIVPRGAAVEPSGRGIGGAGVAPNEPNGVVMSRNEPNGAVMRRNEAK